MTETSGQKLEGLANQASPSFRWGRVLKSERVRSCSETGAGIGFGVGALGTRIAITNNKRRRS